MNKTPLVLLLAAPFFVSTASAQDEDGGITVMPVDTNACSYNEGKTAEDLMPIVDEWNAFLDERGIDDHFALMATPQYYGEWKMDFGWLGASPTAESFGAGRDLWMKEGGDIGRKFAEVITCHTHTNYAATEIKSPPEALPDKLVMTFSNCSVQEGKEWDEVFAGADAWAAWQTENSVQNGTWMLFPAWGEPDDDYDFKVVNTYPNHKQLGRAWDLYGNGGGFEKFNELLGPLIDCDSGRVYDASVMRRPAPEEEQ